MSLANTCEYYLSFNLVLYLPSPQNFLKRKKNNKKASGLEELPT